MNYWEFGPAAIGGLTVGTFLTYLLKKEGIERPTTLFLLKTLLYVILAVVVLGFGTRAIFKEESMRQLALTLIYLALGLFFYWKRRALDRT